LPKAAALPGGAREGGFVVPPQTVDAIDDVLDRHVGIRRAVGPFFARTAADGVLINYFACDRAEEMRLHLMELLSAALADPHRFHPAVRKLAQVHQSLKITDAAFDRVLGHLNAAFVDAGTDDGTSRRVLVALSGMRTDIVSA
jgi:hemoglobin